MEFVEAHPGALNSESWNNNISWEFVEAHPEASNRRPWNMYTLSPNPNVPWEFVETDPKPCDYLEAHLESFN